MGVVIVTKKCYIVAERIDNIVLDCQWDEYGQAFWGINVRFIPIGGGNNVASGYSGGGGHGDNPQFMVIKVNDKVLAYQVFTEMVNQIREQLPDQLFLGKLTQSFLTGGPLDEPANKRSNEGVSKTRKSKRRSKKVLRKSKGRNRKRR